MTPSHLATGLQTSEQPRDRQPPNRRGYQSRGSQRGGLGNSYADRAQMARNGSCGCFSQYRSDWNRNSDIDMNKMTLVVLFSGHRNVYRDRNLVLVAHAVIKEADTHCFSGSSQRNDGYISRNR